MKPYGQNKKMRHNIPDVHPQKGRIMWWKVEWGGVDKGAARQEAKRDIRKELDEND